MRRQLELQQQQQRHHHQRGEHRLGLGGKVCNYKFALITHGDNGSFWSVVYKGAKNAASDLGCTLTETYGSQQQGQAEPDDNAENAQIQNAINAHVDGIAVSDHDPSLMNPTLKPAAAKGIPVVLLNAGCDNQTSPPAARSPASASPSSSPARPPARAFKQARRDQRAVRDPPVRSEPARPLQRHRAGPRRRPDSARPARRRRRARPAPS